MTEKTRCLFVADDDPAICRLIVEIFQPTEYHVLVAKDGVEALTQISACWTSIDVLLVDLVMPRLNGAELARVILSCHPNIKIVFMSGQADDIVERYGISASKMRFLKKPFTPETLESVIREVMKA